MVNVLLGQAKVHNENGLVFLHARPGAEEKDYYRYAFEQHGLMRSQMPNITRKVYSPP